MPPALLDFTDKPNQKAFFYDRARNVSFWGGFFNGKTYAACMKAYLLSEWIPENVGIIARKTYPALEKSTMKTFLDIVRARNGGTLNPGLVIKQWNKTSHELIFQNGSIVWFVTLDDIEKLRGPNIGWAVIDQTEETEQEFWQELNGRIRMWGEVSVAAWKLKYRAIVKEKLDFVPTPYNQLICVGNPSAKAWVREKFLLNKEGYEHVYHAATTENKKYLPLDYIDELLKRYPPEWSRRFIEGSWDIVEGMVYTDFNIDEIHGVPAFDIPAHWPRFLALDHGVVNPTCVLWGAIDEAGRVFLYKEYYEHSRGVDQHAPAILELCKGDQTPMTFDNKVKVYMDYALRGDYDAAGVSMWDHYLKHGIYGLNANKEVLDGIQTVSGFLRPRDDQEYPAQHRKRGKGAPKVFILDGCCPWLVKELQAYQWEPTKEGRNAPEKPRKFFDHATDCARYLLQAVKEHKAKEVPKEASPAEKYSATQKAIAEAAFTQTAFDEDGLEFRQD